MHWNNICFFPIFRENLSLRHLLNNKESGFLIESPQSFSILIDIPSCARALLEFKSCISFNIFFESISPTVLNLLEVSEVWIDGRVLLFGTGWHCLLKKSLKILHWVKSVRILSYSGPYFPAFRLNTQRRVVFSSLSLILKISHKFIIN